MSHIFEAFRIEKLIELGRLREAEQQLATAFQEDPDQAELKILAAKLHFVKKDFRTALDSIENCLAESPHDEDALALRFQIQDSMELYAEAEKDIITLLQRHPQRGSFWASYALLLLKTGHTEKAFRLADEAMRLDPENSHCVLVYCIVHLVQGSAKNIERELEQLVRENPDYEPTLLLVINKLVQSHRKKEAFALARHMVRLNPGDESIVSQAKDLALHNHWSMKPFRILDRFGWLGSAGLWLLFVLIMGILENSEAKNSSAILYISYGYLGFCLASWVWPPLLKKWIHHKGFR
jgi:tetratricopeptide (TPR) repeat protein